MNIPFELIFIVLFFVLPALGNLIRHLSGRGQQPTETTRPTRSEGGERGESRRPPPTRPTTTASTTTSPASSSSSPASSGNSGEGAGTWLEEAQRRVREAQEAENDRRGRRNVNPRTRPQTLQPQASQPQTPAPPGPARAPQPTPQAARPRTPSLEGRTLEGGSLESYRPAYSSLESGSSVSGARESSRALKTAPPLNVQRLGGGKRATMAQAVRLDEQSLMNGFIWHQVLSPPLSKSRRTRLSRRQL